ncbi:MAG: 5-formyltetrahydrofolate cyclo-ligase [Petroclostridium sp.]|uniref:5-formyltetrahydrofolate cyclo-ligase n=1 Tax=Petroclostridium xylanilyticum TaxID=1792311 RepID=UPI000B97E1DD|nr:5-formyltetrahydrofolate cyclo-ligase [Petroclostridium xylanilyticum]MDK2809565.1 5-formyltetrahydrofolate cyclo-ligase [Petroclostridium sp.]
MNKKELRNKYLKMRKNLQYEEVEKKSKNIIQKLMDTAWYRQSNTIMSYIDFRNEVITRSFIKHALKDNKRIIVPITDMSSKILILSELKDFDNELCQSSYGILEPKKEYVRVVSCNLLDLVLVPGLAFDTSGYRIGYGGGYYDRLLQRLPQKTITIGLAFEFQIVGNIPVESFDRKVDFIITEERIIRHEH